MSQPQQTEEEKPSLREALTLLDQLEPDQRRQVLKEAHSLAGPSLKDRARSFLQRLRRK